jgi:Ca2+-binding RTX toxin-like protein
VAYTAYRTVAYQEVVQVDAGVDTLELGIGIGPQNLLLQLDGSDLVIGIREPGSMTTDLSQVSDQIRIEDWSNQMAQVESIRFAGGTELSLTVLIADLPISAGSGVLDLGAHMDSQVPAITGNEALVGTSTGDSLIVASDAGHTIDGLGGDDTLQGGSGNDFLVNSSGDDTFRFGLGGGQDIVTENQGSPGDTDRVVFGEGIGQSDILFWQDGVDLSAGLIGSPDKITIRNWFNVATADEHSVKAFELADGSSLNHVDVQQLVNAMAGFVPADGYAANGVVSSALDETTQNVIATAWQPNTV